MHGITISEMTPRRVEAIAPCEAENPRELVGQLRSWERAQGFTAVVIL